VYFLLFFSVYTESHPRTLFSLPIASALPPRYSPRSVSVSDSSSFSPSSFTSSNSFLPRPKGRGAFSLTSRFKANVSLNSFEIRRFRTLALHSEATVSSNFFEIKRFHTLCKIPGIGYPPPSPFLDSFLMPPPQSSTLAIRARRSYSFSRVTGPLRASPGHLLRVTYSFRINTCKSVSKQTTLTLFRMNTYEKHGGGVSS
jgi:hypothetical protein